MNDADRKFLTEWGGKDRYLNKYRTDPFFHSLVNSLGHILFRREATEEDLLGAVILAVGMFKQEQEKGEGRLKNGCPA